MNVRAGRWKVVFAVLVAAAAVAKMLQFHPLIVGMPSKDVVTSYLYMAAFLVWGSSIRNRLLPSPMRTCASASAWCMVAWMVVRCFKYSATYFLPGLGRLCWYAYYPLMLALAVLFFAGCAHALMHGNRRHMWPSIAIAGLCAAVLSVAVLTNDLHQWAFSFAGGMPDENDAYNLGPAYWASIALMAILVTASIACLVLAARSVKARWRLAAPFAALAAAFAYLFALNSIIRPAFRSMGLDAPFFFAETCCIAALIVWEWLVSCRLIPSNERYGELFAAMEVPALVTDVQLNGVYETAHPLEATRGQFSAALDGSVMIDAGAELHGASIRAGYVFWAADVTELAQMADRLEEIAGQLSERNQIIAAENELSERRERIAARARVYADAEGPFASDLQTMRTSVARMRGAGSVTMEELLVQAIRLAFVKRAMNLRLSGAGGTCVSASDMCACLAEVMRCLKLAGVKCSAVCSGEGDVDVEGATEALRTFAQVGIELHGCMSVLLATVDARLAVVKLAMEPPCARLRQHGHSHLQVAEGCDGGDLSATVSCDIAQDDGSNGVCAFDRDGGARLLAERLLCLGVPAAVEDGVAYAAIGLGAAGGRA